MLLRICYILVFVSCITSSFAQSDINQLVVDLNTDGKSFKEIIQQLEKEHHIPFSYNDDLLPKQVLPKKIYEQVKLSFLLSDLFNAHNLSYTIINSQIVLFKANYKQSFYSLNGFIVEKNTGTSLIGVNISVKNESKGSISNGYGFYALKLPVGQYTVQISCLGYKSIEKQIYMWGDSRLDIALDPISYSMSEVLVNYSDSDEFKESNIINLTKIDINTLQELPCLLGENDALRNLSLLPGIQSNEMSTGSIFVRGGNTEQTIFMMDEAVIYNPSHFGGFFSVFNPDVVNNVNVFKGDLYCNEGGALSSVVDVRLRDGDLNQWKVKGGIGVVSARLSIEGPIIKDTSSLLLAVRRSYIDRIMKYIGGDETAKEMSFHFFDANLKFNYKFNPKNRIYLSGYGGSDSFSQFSKVKRYNTMISGRWNHLFNSTLFANTSVIYTGNNVQQVLFENKDEVNWKSNIYSLKLKVDFTHLLTKNVKLYYGYSGVLYHITPYSYESISESGIEQIEEAPREQLLLNSIYFSQESNVGDRVNINCGLRASSAFSSPFDADGKKFNDFLYEPSAQINYYLNNKTKLKASYNHREQPLHQLYLNMVGIAVNRWMPATNEFKPQKSNNYSFGFFRNESFNLDYSIEAYYRKMDNLIETLQEMRILYSSYPEQYLYPSSGKVKGIELSVGYSTPKFRAIIAYDYANVLWRTESLNDEKPYEASHAPKNNISISGVYKIGRRLTASAVWKWSSGTPFTAATGKYVVDGKVYLKYDLDKINTKHLPSYHRLDLSLDIEGKKNNIKRWKSFWNFSVYNAYFHKNTLGVVYFSTDNQVENSVQKLNPQYFYLYQFVPSVSYRFIF